MIADNAVGVGRRGDVLEQPPQPSTVSRRHASEAQLGAGLPPAWTNGTGLPSPGSINTSSSGCWALHHAGACRYNLGKK